MVSFTLAIYLGEKLGYNKMEDWYQISQQDFIDHNGLSALRHYNNSPALAVMDIFEGHNWLFWKFNVVPKGYWQKPEAQLKFLKYPSWFIFCFALFALLLSYFIFILFYFTVRF
jgi:hypothetical protein